MVKKIIYIFNLILLIIIGFSFYVANIYVERFKDENVSEADASANRVISSSYKNTIDNITGATKSIAAALDLDPNKPFDETKLQAIFERIISDNNAYIDMLIVNQSGKVFLYSLGDWVEGYNAFEKKPLWFENIINGKKNHIITPPYEDSSNKHVVAISVPLPDFNLSKDKPLGALVLEINLSGLMPQNGIEYAITNQEGIILATDVKSLSWIEKSIFTLNEDYKNLTDYPKIYVSKEGEMYSVSKKQLENSVSSYVFTDQVQIQKNAKSIQTGLAILLIVLGVSMSLALYFLIRRELRQIPMLVNTIKSMSDGNFKHIDIPKCKNEIDEISTSTQDLQYRINNVIDVSHQTMDRLSDYQNQAVELANINIENSARELEQIEQASKDITEMALTANDIASNAQSAKIETTETLALSDESITTMRTTAEMVQQVSSSISESAKHIEDLKDLSDNISSVVDVIGNISDQTNLLALNAAIEAARAGQQGRGFAVVADEVRALAVKTQQSTLDIQKIINTLQNGAVKAVDSMHSNLTLAQELSMISHKIEESFNDISHKVSVLSDLNSSVAQASNEQSILNQNIEKNIVYIKGMLSTNVDNLSDTINSMDDIAELIRVLKSEFAFFKRN